jgi:molecular chaperone IbpA
LVREVPEALKPRKISINQQPTAKVVPQLLEDSSNLAQVSNA